MEAYYLWPRHYDGTVLFPKLRTQFAEFPEEGSLVRLWGITPRLPVSDCGTDKIQTQIKNLGIEVFPGN